MMRQVGKGEGDGSGRMKDSSLYGLLGDPGKRNAQLERAKIGAEAINAGLINKTDWRDTTTR